jgi:hypothetical protein
MRLVICDLNRKASPSPSTVRLAELASVNVCVCWKFLHFASASSSLGDLFNEPLCSFGIASFFIGCLLDEPLCVFLGCLFFHQRSF